MGMIAGIYKQGGTGEHAAPVRKTKRIRKCAAGKAPEQTRNKPETALVQANRKGLRIPSEVNAKRERGTGQWK